MKLKRSPCFVLEGQNLILPAFGTLTGGTDINPGPERRIFPIIDEMVFSI